MRCHRHPITAAVLIGSLLALPALPRPAHAGEDGPPGPPFPVYPGTPPLKSADRATVAPGGTITWTITIYNDAFTGPADVYLSDDVPDPADFVPPAPVPAFDARIGGDIVSLPLGSSFTYVGNDSLSVSNISIPGKGAETAVLRTRVLASALDGTQICNRAYFRYFLTDCSGSPPLCRDVTYDGASRPPGGADTKTCVTVKVPKPIEVVTLPASTKATDSCLVDPTYPAPDGVFSPGETVGLFLAIRNDGAIDATAAPAPITGTLSPGTGYSIVQGTSAYMTTVVANNLQASGANQGTNNLAFAIRIDPAAACPGSITVPLVISNIRNGPFTVNYTFAIGSTSGGCTPHCLDLKLQASAGAVRDLCTIIPPGNNGKIDPGDDAFLFLPIDNTGLDDWLGNPDLTATLTTTTPGITILNGSSAYPTLRASGSSTNQTEFGIRVADTVACGTSIALRLTLTGLDLKTRTVDTAVAVASPCVKCLNLCKASAAAKATGTARLCPAGTVQLDSAGSQVTDCSGVTLYQWYEGANPIPGALSPTYDVPTTLGPGNYAYSVEVTCSTLTSCGARSSPIDVLVDPPPLVVRRLLAIKQGLDVLFQWNVETTATGGYHAYRTQLKQEIPASRTTSPPNINVTAPFSTAPDPNANQGQDPGVVPGLPVNPALFHYQILASCSDQLTEGPN